MKTKSTSRSAFFNRRVVISLPVLTGPFLALVRSRGLARWRRMFCSLFFVAAAIAALGAIGSSRAIGQSGAAGSTASKIAPWVIEHTANGQQAEFMVVLVDQADLRPAAALATKNQKSRYVHDALWNKSRTTARADPAMVA
jgi:hypothetical protein